MSAPHNYKGILYLVLLLIILPIAVWNLSLKKTVTKWRSYRIESKELALIGSTNHSASSSMPVEHEELINSGGFIKSISVVAGDNDILIEKYTPFVTYKADGIEINSAEVLMAGDYIPLVKMIDYIEKDMVMCKLISVNFTGTEERRTGKIKLTATIVIQQLTDFKIQTSI